MRALPVRRLGELIFSIQIGHGKLGMPMIIEAVGHFTFKSLHGGLVNIDVLVADSPSEAALVLRGDRVIDLVVEIGDLRPRLIFFCLKPDIEGPGFSGSRCSLPQTWTCMRPMLRSIWEYSSMMDGAR